jgi:hypothetical protein
MEEIHSRITRYKDIDLEKELSSYETMVSFSGRFYFDVAEIYDSITRIKNVERNPSGFSLNDAPILGLLVRIWKILKEIVACYGRNNADIVGFLDRPLIESAVVATYLLKSNDEVVEDYRKCSYKDRLRIMNDAASNAAFFNTPAGTRLLKSVQSKMQHEGLTIDSFISQKKNRWKLQGKNFFQIFSEVETPDFYKFLYGIPSESIHGSWNDSMDYHLARNDDGTFSTYPHYQEVDVRFVTPLLRLCDAPYRLWLKRIDAESEYVDKAFNWIRAMNARLFERFEDVYAERGGQ